MHVESLDARSFSETDALAIGELLARVWPKPDKPAEFRKQQMLDLGVGYSGPDAQAPRSFVIRDGGKVLAHAAVFPRTIGTSTGETTIAALCRVCSDPECRGQGFGELVVRGVFDLVDAGEFRWSLFQTTPPVRPFYEKLGAAAIDNTVVNSLGGDPREHPFWDPVLMRYPAAGDWPAGEIDLRGPGY
jgi:GNAT superfamily N-acetyltransferase